MSNKIGVQLVLDGEKQYRSALQAVNAEQKNMSAQLKLVASEYRGNANSIEALTAKQGVLKEEYDTTAKKIRLLDDAYKNAAARQEQYAAKVEELDAALEQAKAELENMTSSTSASAKEIKEQETVVESLQKQLKKATSEYLSAESSVQRWETQLNEAKADLNRLNDDLEQNEKYMEEADNSYSKTASSIDEYGQAIKEAQEETSVFADVLKADLVAGALQAAGSAIKDLGADALELVADSSAATAQLQASTGATNAEMQKLKSVMDDIYKNNYGEDYNDIAEAVSLIKRNLQDLDESDLQGVTESAIALRDTFGFDFQEQLRAVKMLMETFGTSAEEAYNLITQGAQQGLDKNGDLLDTINEYSVHYKNLGMDAEEMMNSLKNGTEGATFSVDKLGDSWKEFGIRAKDTAATTTEAYQLLGLDADQMREKFAAGGETARQATQEVCNALFSMDDQVKQNQAGVDLFGTMWEDLGIDAVKALMDTNGEIKATKNAMESLKTVKYTDVNSRLEELGRKFKTEVAKPIVEEFLPVAEKGIAFVIDKGPEIVATIGGIGAALVTYKAANEIAAVVEGFQNMKTATDAAAESQGILNTIMNANPYVLVATAVAGVVAAVLLLDDGTKQVSEDLQELADKNQELITSAQQVADAVDEVNAGYEENLASLEAETSYAEDLVDQLYQLEGQTEKTAAQKAYMEQIVSKLNELYPEMNASLDEESGALNMTRDAMLGVVSASEKYQKAILAQEYRQEILKGQMELEIELYKLQDAATEMEEKRTAATEAYNAAMEKVDQNMAQGINQQGEMVEAQSEYISSTAELDAQLKENAAAQEELTTKISDTNTELEAVSSYMENEGAEALNSYQESTMEMADSAQTATEQVAAAYEEMRGTIGELLESQINMFEEFDGSVDLSTEALLNNMQTQIDGMRDWQENLSSLANRGINEDLLQYLANMGPEGAGYVALFAEMSNEELENASSMWAESLDMKEQVQTSVADMLTGYQEGLKEGTDGVAESMREGSEAIGEAVNEGTASGIENSTGQATDAAKASGEQVIQQSKSTFQVNSPSRVYTQIGMYLMQGLASGITKNVNAAKQAMDMAAKQINQLAQTAFAQGNYTPYGVEMGKGLAAGISSQQSAISSAAQNLCAGANHAVKNSGGSGTFYNVGVNMAYGMASGIRDGSSSVISATANLCAQAVNTAKNKLKIHSPSKVFGEIGEYSAEGYGSGFEKKMKGVNRIIAAAMAAPKAEIGGAGIGSGSGGFTADDIQQYLQYLPYLKVIAETRPEVYFDKTQAARILTPGINRELQRLNR